MSFIRTILILVVFGVGMATGGAVEAGTSPVWLAFAAVISLGWVLVATLAAWVQD